MKSSNYISIIGFIQNACNMKHAVLEDFDGNLLFEMGSVSG
jgi:hypothetical protein